MSSTELHTYTIRNTIGQVTVTEDPFQLTYAIHNYTIDTLTSGITSYVVNVTSTLNYSTFIGLTLQHLGQAMGPQEFFRLLPYCSFRIVGMYIEIYNVDYPQAVYFKDVVISAQ